MTYTILRPGDVSLQTAGRLPDKGSQGRAVNPVTVAVTQSDELKTVKRAFITYRDFLTC